MDNYKLLDCTLRDGGFVNDWDFGKNTLTSVFERLVDANVDIIEVGLLDASRQFDENRSIFPDTQCANEIYGKINKGNAKIVAMVEYGTCPIENFQPQKNSYLDGIRVIFKKKCMHKAIEFCAQIKALGYDVFTQAVSITSYNETELIELISLVNNLSPCAVSMVDTYGLLHQNNIMQTFNIINKHLNLDIGIGYHAHNNFQMGYANCITMLEQNTNRALFVDGSLYGMGKSAGNAPIELIAMHMNSTLGKNYDVNQMMEAIEINIMPIFKKVQWGYNLFYYVAAANSCHPNYVSYLMNKHTLSIRSINEILKDIDEPKKLLYDKKYIKELYLNYQKFECDDTAAIENLTNALKGKQVLLLGPGKSIVEKQSSVQQFLDSNKCVVIPINYIPDAFKADYLFLTNAKRYVQLSTSLNLQNNSDISTIATSNLTKTSGRFTYSLNYSSLIDKDAIIQDNSLIMLLRLLINVGVKNVALAGFDGYSPDEMNYFSTNMEYHFIKEKASELNRYAKEFLKQNENNLNITFVTPSRYEH